MDYLLVNGNPDPSLKTWEAYLDDFSSRLRTAGSAVTRFDLRDMKIEACTGCFNCWHTTPGLCRRRDDMEKLYQAILGMDITVWASPLVLGNVSGLTKTAQDRIIPLLHPFFEIVDGECHHRRRYPKKIDMGLIVSPDKHDKDEDLSIVRRLHERFALNGHGRLMFFATTLDTAAEAARQAKEASHETTAA
jgi:multimeric flavodoxin WrbA